MAAPNKDDFDSNERSEGSNRGQSSGSATAGRGFVGDLTERLRGVLRGELDTDLLLDRREVEIGIAQWLRALDLQVLGACRADERLKPLLKLNISSGLAEDRLISQLSQHFDASEVGMLARCLCIPLVSIRVGKVNKQGNLLCPTATRGNLKLSLLSSSSMRISFTGDDGCTERLAVLSNEIESSEVVIEQISVDSTGRSFLLKLPGSPILYFWCSERSKDHGMKLLAKMKNLMKRKPSLTRLTGICESRLDSFATHLRAYLIGSSNTAEAETLASSGESLASLLASHSDLHSPLMVSKSSRCRFSASPTTKGQPSHQGSLSPRPNTFKDGTVRNSSSTRNGIKEKLKRWGDGYHSRLLSISQPSMPISALCTQTNNPCEDDTVRSSDSCSLSSSISQPKMPWLCSSPSPSIPLLVNLPPLPSCSSSSLFSPYYCWCPPCPPLQYSITHNLPLTFDETMPLPPLSSLLSAAVPPVSLVKSDLSPDISSLPTLSLPSHLPEPLVNFPIPVTSLVALPISQQISTFAPYMSDPIVHIPVIDICSSGQGYFVSAAISSGIPPLHSSFVNHPLISNTESDVEKSARETLRMLMASTPSSSFQKPMIILPDIDVVSDNILGFPGCNHDTAATQNSCSGIPIDVEAVMSRISVMGLSSSVDTVNNCMKRGKLDRNDHDCVDDSSKN